MPHSGWNEADFAPELVILASEGPPVSVVGTIFSVDVEFVVIPGGIEVVYHLTNLTSTAQRWPFVAVPSGWNDSGGTDPLRRAWWSKYRYKPQIQGAAPGNPLWSYGIDVIPSFNAYSAAICLDNSALGDDVTTADNGAGVQSVGFATDFPYTCDITLFTWSPGKIFLAPTVLTGGIPRALPNFIPPGETRSIRIWMKVASGAGNAAAVEVVKPYVDWMRATYPFNPPPMPRGRYLGVHVAQHEMLASGGRQYNVFAGKTAAECRDCDELLENILLDPVFGGGGEESFRARGFTGIILWAFSGFESANAGNYFPSPLTNCEPHLYRTLEQIPKWIKRRGISLGLWMGRAMSAYQPGPWNGELYRPLEHGNYQAVFGEGGIVTGYVRLTGAASNPGTPIAVNDLAPWKLTTAARAQFEYNVFRALSLFDGIGLDALPDPLTDPWVLDYLRAMRTRFPGKWFAIEQSQGDKSLGIGPQWWNQGSGVPFDLRCPLQEAMYPGHRGFAAIVAVDPPNIPPMVETIEEGDHVPVILHSGYPGQPDATPTRDLIVRVGGVALKWGETLELGSLPLASTRQLEAVLAPREGGVTVSDATSGGDAAIDAAFDPPYDLGGEATDEVTLPLNLSTESGGEHSAAVEIAHTGDGGPFVFRARWSVNDPALGPPTRVPASSRSLVVAQEMASTRSAFP